MAEKTILLIDEQPELLKLSKEIFNNLKKEFNCTFDKSGSVGRRYARNDELATPYCITVDFESLEENTVTIRNRDDAKQIRVKITELKETIRKLLNQEIEFEKAGRLI